MDTLRRQKLSEQERFLRLLKRVPVLSPREMDEELESLGYRGQSNARESACLMAYRHVRRARRIYLEGRDRDDVMPKTNYMFMGPTGCGKTFLVELLFREILQLPTVVVDITAYSETGYVGQDTNGVLTRLLHASENNLQWASVGIICLDEFDKLASGRNNAVFAGAGTTKDVTGMGVQRELLKMLEASEVVVPLELGHVSYGDHVIMSTADVGFVACGAFSGFHEVVRNSNVEESIGFRRKSEGVARGDDIGRAFTQEQVDRIGHFYAYGFLPELIARFTRIVPFEALSGETLKDIMRADVLGRMEREFEDEGLELEVGEDVLDAIVTEALKAQTGARGLGARLTRHLEEVAFKSFGQDKSGRVAVRMDGNDVAIEGPE
jgi:ATP-dependent Clp protease ATP-binding subunit ClpX